MGEFSVTIRTHTDTLERAMQKRIAKFTKDMLTDDVRRRAAELYRDAVEKYVPKDSGNLRESAHEENSIVKYKGDYAVLYDVPYAEAQYVGFNGRGAIRNSRRKTGGTYDHWNHHMTTAERQTYYNQVKEEILQNLERNRHG